MTAALLTAATLPCPSCGGKLELVTAPDGYVTDTIAPAVATFAEAARLRYRIRCAPFVACSACEFCREVGR